MIGDRYWSTGITIKKRGDEWGVSLDFTDDGFAESGSTDGELRCRYLKRDLDAAVDALVRDAERLGIRWFDGAQHAAMGGTVYCEQDGELEDGDHPELRRIANEQALRLGWEPAYRRDLPSGLSNDRLEEEDVMLRAPGDGAR